MCSAVINIPAGLTVKIDGKKKERKKKERKMNLAQRPFLDFRKFAGVMCNDFYQ